MTKLAVIILQLWMPLLPFAREEPSDTLSMCLIGDVMMHTRQLEYPMGPFLEDLKERFSKCDLNVANMEFALGGKPYSGYPAFSAPDEYAHYIASLGVNVFLTANNHILDKGSAGLLRTLEVYRSMSDSVVFSGSASNEKEFTKVNPLIILRKGIKLAIINFTYGTNNPQRAEWPKVFRMNKEEISKAIARAKEARADFIVAIPHWGTEYVNHHSKEQEAWAEWLSDQGVSVIVGHHPHVVQDSSRTSNGTRVIYSVGNAVSNMSAKGTRLELAVTLRFVHNSISGEKRMLEPELTPLWCTLPGKLINGYKTVEIDKWKKRRADWIDPSDYDNMIQTLNCSPMQPCTCRTLPCK